MTQYEMSGRPKATGYERRGGWSNSMPASSTGGAAPSPPPSGSARRQPLVGVVQGQLHPPRILVYGPPKIGKSSLGADAESPIFITTEDGVDCLPVKQFPVPATWDGLLKNLWQVAEGDHTHRTIVLDTIDGAAGLAAEHVCRVSFHDDWGPSGYLCYMAGPIATAKEITKILAPLDACRKRGMTVLLLSHTGTQSVKDPVLGDYQKFAPSLDKRIWTVISAWCDVILRADYEISTVSRDGKRCAISDSTRVLKAVGSAVEDAGCRVGYSLPESMPLAWAEVAKCMGGGGGVQEAIQDRWKVLTEEEKKKALQYLGIVDIKDIGIADQTKSMIVLNKLKAKETK